MERKKKAFVPITIVLSSILLLGGFYHIITNSSNEYGPRTPKMLIHLYSNPDAENKDLDKGLIDMSDARLSRTWINKWENSADINLRDFTDFRITDFALNNQKWPTGDDTNTYYESSCPIAQAALSFRKAIAYLTDKDRYINEILGGSGYRLDNFAPRPTLPYWYFDNVTIYEYSRAQAESTLASAGFFRNESGYFWKNPDNPGQQRIVPSLKFILRNDDPERLTAGLMLVEEMEALGIPVDPIVADSATCYEYVLERYDYHIYTSKWDLGTGGRDPYWFDRIFLSKSYMDFGAPTVPYAFNFYGYCNKEFDYWVTQMRSVADVSDLSHFVYMVEKLMSETVPGIPLWSHAEMKAYRDGWTGAVNMIGYGVDNYYSFLNIYDPNDDTIDWGSVGEPKTINPITAFTEQECLIHDLVYDSTCEALTGKNPYNLAGVDYRLAIGYEVGTWWNGQEWCTRITYNLRPDLKWQDGTPLTSSDLCFTWKFIKACGPEVAYNYESVAEMYDASTINETAAEMRLDVLNEFAVSIVGLLPVIPRHIWEKRFPNWNTTQFNPDIVKAYCPWKIKLRNEEYPHGVPIPGYPKKYLTEEVGSGAWIIPFDGWHKRRIRLYANRLYFRSQDEVETYLKESFWKHKGDANLDGVIDDIDVSWVKLAYGTSGDPATRTYPPTSKPKGIYNPWCDFNEDGCVVEYDVNLMNKNYGQYAG